MSQNKIKIVYITVMWSLLIYVGYNVLTVEAAEKKDIPDNIREMKFVNDDNDDYGLKSIALKQECKDNGGEWKQNAWCKFDKDEQADNRVEFEHRIAERGLDYYYNDFESGNEEWQKDQNERYEKSQKGEQEYQKYVAKQEAIAEEKAANEDAICDNEDADTTNVKLCMSDKREQQASHNYDKESCEQVNGDWNKKKNSGCTFYEDEQQDVMDAAETQRKLIDEEEQKQLQEIADYNAAQAQKQQEEEVIEDWGNTVSDSKEQAVKEVTKILEESEEGNEVHGGAELEYTADETDNESNDEEEESNDDSEESDSGSESEE